MRRSLPALFLALLLAASSLPAQSAGCKDFDPYLQAAAKSLPGPRTAGSQAFEKFQQSTAEAARKAGGAVSVNDPRFASCLLRRYVIARYGDRMVKDLQEMVRFQTFAVQGKENWDLLELVRQRQWLQGRAQALGLQFKSYDGRVEEITLPGPKPILALLTHGDVEGV